MDNYSDFFEIAHNNINPEKGLILISEPFATDFYFKRSVILVTEYNKKGAMGFILNNFSLKLPVNSILNEFPDFDGKISLGGPVDTDSIFYIHTLGDLIEDSIHIDENLYWGGDFETVKKMIRQKVATPDNIRFFLGYSGWSPEQLDSEIRRNFWLVSIINQKIVLSTDICENLWEDSLIKMGKKYAYWTKFPESPDLN